MMLPTQPVARPCRVRIVVPHFYREGTESIGYGSTRVGTRLARQLQDLLLNPAQQALAVELHVCL